jgi:hypothetical protein
MDVQMIMHVSLRCVLAELYARARSFCQSIVSLPCHKFSHDQGSRSDRRRLHALTTW